MPNEELIDAFSQIFPPKHSIETLKSESPVSSVNLLMDTSVSRSARPTDLHGPQRTRIFLLGHFKVDILYF